MWLAGSYTESSVWACMHLAWQPPAQHCPHQIPADMCLCLDTSARFDMFWCSKLLDNSNVRSTFQTCSFAAMDASSLTDCYSYCLQCECQQSSRLEPSWSSLSLQVPLCLQLAVLCCPTRTPPPPSWRLVQHPCCPMHGSSLPGAPSCPARSAERLAADQIPHPGTRPRVLRSSRRPSQQGRQRLACLRHLRCAGCHSQEPQCASLPVPQAVTRHALLRCKAA